MEHFIAFRKSELWHMLRISLFLRISVCVCWGGVLIINMGEVSTLWVVVSLGR